MNSDFVIILAFMLFIAVGFASTININEAKNNAQDAKMQSLSVTLHLLEARIAKLEKKR